MSDAKPLPNTVTDLVARLRGRSRRVRAGQFGLRGLFYGALAAVVIAAAALLTQSTAAGFPWLSLCAVPLGGLLGAALGALRPLDNLRLARALDFAAAAEDRFASALQLAPHHRRQRVQLVTVDALAHVGGTPVQRALPLSLPREIKYSPIPVLLLAALVWLASGTRLGAAGKVPEVTAEQWAQLEDEFRRRLEQDFDRPESPEEQWIADELRKLASALAKKPEKKDVLAQIAKLRSQMEQRREGLKAKNVAMRKAARALRSTGALKQLAAALEAGQYEKAADALKALADRLESNGLNLSAEEFEAASSDLDRLARELAEHQELAGECENCARAAASMKSQQFADALRRLSEALRRNSDDLRQNDQLCKACDSLNELERRLARTGQCQACQGKGGECQACGGTGAGGDGEGPAAFVRRNNKKGGLRAGWGTADNWKGGNLGAEKDRRLPDVVNAPERQGPSTAFSVTSKEERAESAQSYKELYAKLVQKAEADLALEEVPVAYREFLRRYFNAIKPTDEPQQE